MIITNIENYLTLTGLLVDAFNNEEEIEYPYIGRLSDESELMVECELDLCQTKTADVYFNHDDDDHGIYSFLINLRIRA